MESRAKITNSECLVVGIGGATRSGKGSLSKAIHEHFASPLPVLRQDHYFLPHKPIIKQLGEYNWEGIDAINNDMMLQDLIRMKSTVAEMENVPRFLVVEGFLLFADPKVVEQIDYKIFLSISEETCFKRRMETKPVTVDYFDYAIWNGYLKQREAVLSVPHLFVINAEENDIAQVATRAIGFLEGKVDGCGDYEHLQTVFEKGKSPEKHDNEDRYRRLYPS